MVDRTKPGGWDGKVMTGDNLGDGIQNQDNALKRLLAEGYGDAEDGKRFLSQLLSPLLPSVFVDRVLFFTVWGRK